MGRNFVCFYRKIKNNYSTVMTVYIDRLRFGNIRRISLQIWYIDGSQIRPFWSKKQDNLWSGMDMGPIWKSAAAHPYT